MLLILCSSYLKIVNPPQLPDGTFVFVCAEDFSVGPLQEWNNHLTFQKNRSSFWLETPEFDLPDGTKRDYIVWYQSLPYHNLLELVQRGVGFEDIPIPHQLDDLAPQATKVEIWCDHSVRDCAFLWYLASFLKDMEIDQSYVSICRFTHALHKKRPSKFWSDMLLDTSARRVSAVYPSTLEWQVMSQNWQAIATLPTPIPPTLFQKADRHTLNAFDILMNRHPSHETGLTNLQARLLRSAKDDWLKMARVIGDAMGAGWNENDYVSDGILKAQLAEMSRMTPSLVEIERIGEMRFCKVKLTHEGTRKRQFELD